MGDSLHPAAAKSLQSCPTLCDPIDGSPPGSLIPRILQARTLKWGAISFSNAWKWKVKVKSLSLVRLLATPWPAAHQAPPSMGFSRQEYWSGVPLPSPSLHPSRPQTYPSSLPHTPLSRKSSLLPTLYMVFLARFRWKIRKSTDTKQTLKPNAPSLFFIFFLSSTPSFHASLSSFPVSPSTFLRSLIKLTKAKTSS